jgi:uncharacterized LabA/DUF88 family protein
MEQTMQRVMIFVDHANFAGIARNFERQPDLIKLRDYLADPEEGRLLLEMVVYLGFPPDRREEDMPPSWKQARDRMTRLKDFLEYNGIMSVTWNGKLDSDRTNRAGDPGFSSNIDIIMAMDALEFAVEARPDIVVLVTGDGDFAHLAGKLRRRGIRVEAASMKDSTSSLLRRAVNSFIDLTEFFNLLEGQKIGDENGDGGGA